MLVILNYMLLDKHSSFRIPMLKNCKIKICNVVTIFSSLLCLSIGIISKTLG